MSIKSITYLFLSLFFFTKAQASSISGIDSLRNIDYPTLEQKVVHFKKDTAKSLQITQYWLKKAREEKNLPQQVKAFKVMMHLVDKKYRMIYADSLIGIANATLDYEIIGSAFLTVGAAYYDSKEYINALNAYITANDYIVKTENPYLIHKVKYTIGLTKYFLGYYQEAISLLTQCMDYFREENDLAYIKTIHAISLCYIQVDRHDLSAFYNNLGISLAKDFEIEGMIPYFKNAEGINLFFQKQYSASIELLTASEIELAQKNDFSSQINTWFYLGKCFWALGEKGTAESYLLKVAEGIATKKFNRPEYGDAYELLIQYYEAQKDLEKQLFYIEKLLDYSKKNSLEFKYLSDKVHKEYDTKALHEKKEKIEIELASNKRMFVLVVLLLIVVLSVLVFWHFYSKKREKEKFDLIMADLIEKKDSDKTSPSIEPSSNSQVSLSPELTKTLLKNLEKFESQKRYIEKDINLAKLASILNTNTKYVSLIISNHRAKKTTTYINDLKIDYVVDLLINHKKIRNYTNKALAEEAGFGSTQIFTQSFKSKVGMSPTSFIKQLKKSNENNSEED